MGHLDRRGSHSFFLKMNIATWLSLILGVITIAKPALSSEPRVVCYYTNWSVYRPGTARFNPQNINPYLCTHLIYAFGGFTKDNTLKPFDKYQDIEKGGYAKFTGLKTYNKNLKTLLAIGGWNEGSTRFSPMVASREKRKEFVRNVIKFLRQNRFDGLDLDWEYPAFRDGGKPKDRENYAKLVKEMREEFDREAEKTGKPRLLLTMAVPAGIEYIQKGFDVKTLNQYLDWMNLLTYDYHSAFEPAVNHHAPLYPLEEPNEYSVDTELNIDYTIKFYLENGADADKLVLGIPTYGRSYTLFNADAVEIGSPADGPGEQGDATREKGYLAYYEICESLKPKTKKRSASDEDSEEYEEEEEDEEWTVMHPNPEAMGPVAFKGNQWVGYDDIDIVKKKGEYVAENGLGGIMFWSIDNDDFRGNCHEKPYPLIEAAKEAYLGKLGTTDNAIATKTSKSANRASSGNRRRNRPKASTSTTTPKPSSKSNKRKSSVSSTTPSWNNTPEPPTTPDPGSDFKCVDEGFFPHPRDCKKYFWCLDSGPSNLGIVAHQFTCPSGLFFNKAADSCDFSRNVLCKVPASTTKAPATKASSTKASTTVTTTTTTRKPIRLSTKSSVLFRSSTTTPEPESEEYEDDLPEEITEEDAEDPRVIKELIDLIRKVGGVEQLEKQLHLAEASASTDGASTTTPTPFNKKLYQKVLERARGKNKYPGSNSIVQTAQNSRRGPQNQGLEATADKDRPLKKDRPQYTTINRQRAVASTPEPEDSEEDDQPEEPVQTRARAVESQARETQARTGSGTTTKQYVNIRRARPTTTSDTADDTASRNALFERSEPYISVSEPNSLDIQSSRKENVPEYVTIRRQRPTTEETTTAQYEAPEPEAVQETALEREISSQPQYTSIIRTRGTTVSASEEPSSSETPFIRTRSTTLAPPEELSTPEPTTVLAVQISSLLNSASSDEEVETTVSQTTEAEPTTVSSTTSRPTTTTTTTTTTAAPPSSTRRNLLRRRGSTTTTSTTPGPSTTTTQAGQRTFLRRTKGTSAPDTTDDAPATSPATIDSDKLPKRGGSRFRSRESARNATSAATRRPSLGAGARRSERPPTRNFVRRRPGGANVTTTTSAPASASSTTRRPFRIASRRRPGANITTSTTTTSTTSTQATTLALDSEESLQDIGDIDAIEDPSLEPRAPKKLAKTPRRPLVNLKEELKDQNPSATNEDERKRQSKKYSSSFKQNQLDDLLKAKSGEVTTETGTTLEEYNAETALAIATHQLITAPLPNIPDYEEETKPTRTKTTQKYKTSPEYTNTPTYEEYSTAAYKTNPTSQDFIQTTAADAYSIYTPRLTTFYEDPKTTAEFTANSRRPAYTETYEPKINYDSTKTTADFTANSRRPAYTETYEPKINYDSTKTTADFTANSRRPAYTETYETKINYDLTKTTADFTENSGRPAYTETYEPKTNYDLTKTTEDVTTTDSRQPSTPDIDAGKVSTFVSIDAFSTTPRRQAEYTNIPTDYESRISSTTFEVPKQSGTLNRYSTTPVYQAVTNQYVPTTRDYADTPERSSSFSTPSPLAKASRGFSSPNVITPGYSGVQRGGTKYFSASEKSVTPAGDTGYSTSGYKSSSQDPTYFTREYLLESPVTKTYDDEYQYLSPTTPQTPRKVFRKKIQRRISTTLRPTSTTPTYIPEVTTTPRPARVPSRRPFEKVAKVEPNRTFRPVVNYDYYDDSAEKMALKYAEGTKVILHGKGSIECLDVGNFPHPSSCRKFISCARMEFGALLGWEYICPKGLSFDPVGGICNWSAGLGCDEKDI